jgi:predicted negative regulator of RcsB-dependent stress response
MNDYANEHEQWEGIKTWWKENGTLIVVVMILSMAASFGWRYWQQQQLQKRSEASQFYDQLISVYAMDPNSKFIDRIASTLETNYPRTPYANASALLEAKIAVEKQDLATATKKLQWVIDHSRDASLRTIARIRLARVLLAQKNFQGALALTNQDTDADYLALTNLLRGDIYLAQGQMAQARQAYQDALNRIPPSEPIRNYIEMQLYHLPT